MSDNEECDFGEELEGDDFFEEEEEEAKHAAKERLENGIDERDQGTVQDNRA